MDLHLCCWGVTGGMCFATSCKLIRLNGAGGASSELGHGDCAVHMFRTIPAKHLEFQHIQSGVLRTPLAWTPVLLDNNFRKA